MPTIDWINALASQDNSFEAQLAQRDLTKKLALLENVKSGNEQRRQQKEEFDLRRQDTLAQRDETKRQREIAEKDRLATEKRNRYNTVHDNLKPGDVMRRGPDFDLMNEFGTGNQFTPAADDPDALIYQELAWKQAQLKAEHDKKIQDATQARAEAENKRQEKELAIREKGEARAAKADEQNTKLRQQRIDKAQKELTTTMEALPIHLRGAVKARAEELIKEGQQYWPPEDKVANAGEAWVRAAGEVKQRAQAAGQMPKDVAPQVKSGLGGVESPDHIYWRRSGMIGPEPK